MRFAVLLLLAALCVAPAAAERLVRLYDVTQPVVTALVEDDVEIAAADMREGWVDIYVPDRDVESASLYAPRYEVLPLEWGMLTEESRGNAGYYYSWEESNAYWATLAVQHSDLVDTPVSIGTTYQGRQIMMIQITSNSGGYKPAIYFSAMTHAREPAGISVLVDWAEWLTNNYGSDTMATWILNNTRIYIVPIINIDSYILNCNPAGGNIRKNQSPPNGVDLNRNYAYQWGYNDSGSSPDPYSETYRGPSAASEPETQVIQNFINAIDPIAAMNYHSYGGYLIRPYGYNTSNTPDEATYVAWSNAMTQYNGYSHGQCGEVLGYTSNGDACDWEYYSGAGHPRIMCFTPEVDDNGFWGGQSDSTLIATFCAECRYMNRYLCMVAPGFTGIEEEQGAPVTPTLSLGSVWPNPALSEVHAVLEMPSGGEFRAMIVDAAGRVVASVDDEFRSGTGVVGMPVGDLPSGVYTMVVTGGGGSAGSRFTVLR